MPADNSLHKAAHKGDLDECKKFIEGMDGEDAIDVGFLDAAAIRLQGFQIEGFGQVPVQAVQALPYVLTVILLAGFIGKSVPPRASGIPYTKDR